MLIFVEKYDIVSAHQILRRISMRDFMTVFGVIVVGVVLVMICRCPDAKKNFSKEHRESVVIAIIPLVLFLILAYYLLSHVGL